MNNILTEEEINSFKEAAEHIKQQHAPSNADNTKENETPHVNVVIYNDIKTPISSTNKIVTEKELENIVLNSNVGDMTKAVYDINNSGTVDNADKVNGFTVETAVPANAVFTDTVYDDTSVLKETDIGNIVQEYDANTSKTNVTETFVKPKRTSVSKITTGAIDLTVSQDVDITLTIPSTITINNKPALPDTESQRGRIVIQNCENITGWTGFTWLGTMPTGLTGLGYFGYELVGTIVYIIKVENA